MELKKTLRTSRETIEAESIANCLPTCRVCNGPGYGLHYGVNTCDACKGFFHRTIKLHLQYTCKNDSTCIIEYGRGKMCQLCRYQKCISVGMSKHAIKTGRYTLSRKAECILQMKKKLKTSYPEKQTPESDVQSNCRTDVPSAGDRSSTQFHEDNLTNSVSSVDSTRTLTSTSRQSVSSLTPVQSNESENMPYSIASPDLNASSSSDSMPFIQETAMMTNPRTPTSLCAYKKHNDNGTNNTVCSLLMTPKQDSSTVEPYFSPENRTNSHSVNEDSFCDHPSVSSSAEKEDFSISKLYTHKDVILRKLLETESALHNSCKWTPEELRKQTREHYEKNKMKEEMFGQLQFLSEEEYDRVIAETGIDVDGRMSFNSKFLDGMESSLFSMVNFMKVIPGFLSLDLKDQINLLKYNRLEFNLITHYPFSNVELGVVRCQNDRWLCLYEILPSQVHPNLKNYIKVMGELQNLKLTKEEQAILKAVSAMTPDRNELTNRPSIHEIYWNLTDLLIYCLKKRHGNPHQIFARIMQALACFRLVEGKLKDNVAELNLTKYSQLNKRPLLKEMVTDFYVPSSGT